MNEDNSFSIELRRYAGVLLHWAWMLALTTGLFAAAAYLYSKQTTPVYQSSTLVLVTEAASNRTVDYSALTTNQLLAQTYAQVMTTRPVLEGVADKLGLGKENADSLRGMIQVEPVKDTQLIRISVLDTNPERAATIANALVVVFAQQNQDEQVARYAATKQNLETQLVPVKQQIDGINADLISLGSDPAKKAERDQKTSILASYQQIYSNLLQSIAQINLAETQSMSNIVQKDPAIAASYPIKPRVFSTTIQGAFLGFLLALGLVLLIESLDDTIKDPEEITRRLGLPILGLIASHEPNEKLPVTALKPRSPVAEAYRSLRTNLQYTSVDHPIHTLLVTSPSPEEGKSTVSSNLGVILAQGGARVVIIDADLRRPKQHKLMGINNRKGITELFTYSQPVLNGNLQKTEIENLFALPSGKIPPNPSELLGSAKMVQILEQVEKQAEMIIIDSPPVLAVTDAVVLAQRVDGVLIVMKPGVTKFQAMKQAIDQLQRIGANILGVVLNDVEIKRSGYKYAYYKGYYYADHRYYGDNNTVENQKKAYPVKKSPGRGK